MPERGIERHREETRFSLLEWMVILLIVGILVATTLPSFLGASERAQVRVAQADLRAGMLAARAFFTGRTTFDGFDEAEAESLEPSLGWEDGDAYADDTRLYIRDASLEGVVLLRRSATGAWYGISYQGGRTLYCQTAAGGHPATIDALADCNGSSWT
jgi:type II secretory pathway pseudopilin PulG